MLIGVIGSDFWSAADLAARLGGAGVRTVLGPSGTVPLPHHADQAVVVALRAGGIDPAQMVDRAVQALASMVDAGGRRFHVLTSAGVETTPRSALGPVLETLAVALDVPTVIVCPAEPDAGRTVYQGHLFFGPRLASDAGPVHPTGADLAEPDLRRWLARQCGWTVGHIGHATVRRGVEALQKAVAGAPERLVLIDAITPEDIVTVAAVSRDHRLVAGSSSLAAAIVGELAPDRRMPAVFAGVSGPGIALCASGATASRAQLAFHARNHPSLVLSAEDLVAGSVRPEDVARFLERERDRSPVIAVSVDPFWSPGAGRGRDALPRLIDEFFAHTSGAAIDHGYRRIVVAGSQTAAAVARTLAGSTLVVGPPIDDGVPALRRRGSPDMAVAWKWGNVGSRDLFERALASMGGVA